MTGKPSRSFFASAVSHRDAPDQYLGSFAMPGEEPQWVMENGRVKVFGEPELAELAGFRILAARLNRAKDVQEFISMRNTRNNHRVLTSPPHVQRAHAQAESVFRK